MSDAPKIVHRYEIVERLGQGGMGDLYLGRDPMLDRFVAIKMLKAGSTADDLRERFAREARSAARLAHVNIVTIYDVGEHEGQPYIAMEYVLGETLLEKIRRRSDLPLATKLQYVDELCAGLAHAHRAGIIHRDIKPANLIVAAEGTLKILDFGIARLADSSMTQSGMMLGTLNYMSPEQISGPEVDHRSDIFAVGAVFYELLSYQQAFPGAIDTVLSRILYGTPAPLTQLCPGLDASIITIVDRALAKSADERFEDLTAMRAELARTRERLDRKVLEAPVTTSRLSSGKIPIAVPTPGHKTPRRGTTREEIKRRRAEEVAGHLAAARNAFAAAKFEEASAACERALIIEQDNEEALDLSERARAAIEQNQIHQWALDARGEIEQGNIEAARNLLSSIVALDAESPEARSLRVAIGQLESRRTADKAVADGRHYLESGDAAAAAAAAREALRANPTHAGAASLLRDASLLVEAQRRKAEHDRQARDAIASARRTFDSGAHDAAIAALEQFAPSHGEVDAALEALRTERREIQERDYALAQQAAAEIVIAQAWLARDELSEASAAIERARVIAPAHPGLDEIDAAIDRRRDEIEARRRQEDDARREAEVARQRAEQEARRKAEEAAKRKKADEEARRRAAEDARRRAEEDARRKKEEEARLAAAIEAQRIAEEEAAREAEEEARRQVEEEARRKAEEEAARLKAESDARREEARRAEEARRLEEARRYEEERRQQELRRRAEQEAQRKADEEAKKAEAERQAAEAAKRAAEEAARRKAIEEKRLKTEAEARRRAEEENKRKAEAEARRAAEAEQRRKADDEAARRKAEEAEAAARQKAADEQARRDEEEARQQADVSDRKLSNLKEAKKKDEARQREAAASRAAAAIEPATASTDVTPAAPLPLMSPDSAPRTGSGAKQIVPIAAAAIVLLALVGFGIWQFTGNSGEQPQATTPATPAPTAPVTPQQSTAPPAAQPSSEPATPAAQTPSVATVPAPGGPAAPADPTTPAPASAPAEAIRQITTLVQRDQLPQALAAAEKVLPTAPADPQLAQALTALQRRAQEVTQRAKDDAANLGAQKSADTLFSEGTSREAEASTRARGGDRAGSIRSLIAAADAFGRAARQARDANDKTAADEAATRAREAEEKRLADLKAKEQADALARQEQERRQKEARVEPTPPAALPKPAPGPPPPVPPGAPTPAQDEESVRATLRQYEAAYESLDVNAVMRVYPGVRQQQLAAAFKQYRSYELDINIQRIEFGPARMRAMVAARVTYAFQPLSGRRMENTVAQQFLLQREGSGWRIEGIK